MWVVCTSFVGAFASYGGSNLKGGGFSITVMRISGPFYSLNFYSVHDGNLPCIEQI